MVKELFRKKYLVFLFSLTILVGFLFTLPPKAFSAGETITWNLSVWGGKRAWTNPVHDWVAEMDKKTNGQWKIKIHYGAVLAPAKENFDGIRAGMFEAGGY